MFQRLNPEEICARFEKTDVQVHVSLLVGKMNQQGLIPLFIKPKALYELACELKREGAIEAEEVSLYCEDVITNRLNAHISRKLCGLMEVREDVTAENVVLMVGLQAAEICKPKNAHILFSWMVEFVYPIKVKFSEYLKRIQALDSEAEEDSLDSRSWSVLNGFWKLRDKRMERLMEMCENAIPCGMNPNADTTMWKYTCYTEFKSYDISAMLNRITFDRYYAVIFKHAPTYENVLDGSAKDCEFSNVKLSDYYKKDDLRKEINFEFKLMVFEAMLNEVFDPDKFLEMDHKELVKTAVSKRPMWVAFMYIIAMTYVNHTEHDRLSKLAFVRSDVPSEDVMPE